MRIRISHWADSLARAHTWRKPSLVHKIIQHVEYSAPMARVPKIAENCTAPLGNVPLSSAVSSSVRRALGKVIM